MQELEATVAEARVSGLRLLSARLDTQNGLVYELSADSDVVWGRSTQLLAIMIILSPHTSFPLVALKGARRLTAWCNRPYVSARCGAVAQPGAHEAVGNGCKAGARAGARASATSSRIPGPASNAGTRTVSQSHI